MKIPQILLLVAALALSACNSPERYATNKAAGDAWLAANSGKAGVNVSGRWVDVTRDAWGHADLKQTGNKVSGTLGNYEVTGVVNGSKVFLLLHADQWNYYAVEVVRSGPSLQGFYSHGPAFNQAKRQEFHFRQPTN